jgi:hypothetical protein
MTWQAVTQKKTHARIVAGFGTHAGRPVALEFTRETPPATAATPPTREELVQRARQEPLVQKALEVFGGEIIDVEE